MTEENNTNTGETASMEAVSTAEGSSSSSGEETATHQPSNLRRRWKRKSGAATIKEDDTSGPRELKTVKIKSDEGLNPSFDKESHSGESSSNGRSRRKSSCERCCCDHSPSNCESHSCGSSCGSTCYCRCFFGKIKHFILQLFGFGSKPAEQKSKHYSGRNKRTRYPRRRSTRSNYRS